MASEDTQLIVGLEARVDAFEKAFNRAGSIADTKFSAIEKRVKEAGDRMSESMGDGVDKINEVLGAIGIGFGLREMQEMVDTHTRLSAQIKAVSGSAKEAGAVMEELGNIAKRNRQDADALTASYAQNKRALDSVGISAADQLRWLEAFNAEGKLSGSTTDAIAQSYQQLTTSLETGQHTLRVFTDLVQQNREFMNDLAKDMGTTLDGLAAQWAAGLIGPAEVNKAIRDMSNTVKTEMAGTQETIEEAITGIKNAFAEFITGTNDASGASKKISDALDEVAKHMNVIGPIVLTAGGLLTLGWTAKTLGAITATKGLSGALTGLALAYEAVSRAQAVAAQQKQFGAAGLTWGDEWEGLKALATGDRTALRDRLQREKDAGQFHPDQLKSGETGTDETSSLIDEIKSLVDTLSGEKPASHASSGSTPSVGGLHDRNLGKGFGSTPALMSPAIPDNSTPHVSATEAFEQLKALNPQVVAIQNYNQQLAILNDRLKQATISQEEFNREKTKLDESTLAARDPIRAIVESQQEELQQMQVIGQYREADLKTLQEITALKKQGIAVDQETADALKASNRALQDVKDMQGTLDGLTSDFGSGLSNAIAGALNGQKYAFAKFGAELGKRMMDQAFGYLSKQAEGGLEGMFGTPGVGAAQSAISKLKGLGDKEAEHTIATANITAGTVNVTGKDASGAAGNGSTPASSTSGAGGIGSDAKFPTTDSTPTGSTGTGGAGGIGSDAVAGGAAITAGAGGLSLHDRNLGAGFGGVASTANSGASTARQAIEAYYGKSITDSQYKDLINATSAEASGGKGNPQEQAMITASILNRARTNPGGIEGALHAPNQFQSVTGTAANGHQPSAAFVNGPSLTRSAQIDAANQTYLADVPGNQTDFTAASRDAYGPGTDVSYLDKMQANGGSIYGGSIFNTSLPDKPPASNNVDASTQKLASQLQAQEERQQQEQIAAAEKAAQKLTQGLLSGGAGGLESGASGLLGMLPGLFGFASGGPIRGSGSPTSDSNLALVSDGEYIVNANAAKNNGALLDAINSGKAPSFSGPSNSAFLNANSYSPTVNVHVDGGSLADKQLASRIADHVTKGVNASARGFRYSGPQTHAAASHALSKASHKNG